MLDLGVLNNGTGVQNIGAIQAEYGGGPSFNTLLFLTRELILQLVTCCSPILMVTILKIY
jgi:hypothetical protein